MRNDFIEKTGLNFPKLPINIRWGQWILFMNFIMMHYDVIRRYFEDKTDGKHLFDILSHSDFKNELCEIYEFKDLPKLITCLEKEGLKVSEQINIVSNFRNTIIENKYLSNFDKVWETNPGMEFFKNFNENECDEDDRCYMYAPLSSVWVERSFSGYRYIFNDLRQCLTVESLEILLFFYFNKI